MKSLDSLLGTVLIFGAGILAGLIFASAISGVMSSILAAIVAVCGAIIAGYVTNFVAEDFRRFRDGSALAAALSGELSAHGTAIPMLRNILNTFMENVQAGKSLPLRPIERPNDPVFDAGVAKLGLLGCDLVSDIVYVYQQIRAFRGAIGILYQDHAEMTSNEFIARCAGCLDVIDRAMERAEPLLKKLQARANQEYALPRPWALLER